jgi:hypothetical protein
MWHDDIEAKKKSSGLWTEASPLNAGSALPFRVGLFSMIIS